jgi:hypothetical protein
LPCPCLCIAEERRQLEYNNSVNTSAQAHHYLDTHPDFLDAYGHRNEYSKVMSSENKVFKGDATRASSFRHKGDDSVLRNSVSGKGPSYFYSDDDYFVANQGRHRISNDAGEQEEILAPEFQGDHVLHCHLTNRSFRTSP